MLKLDIQRFAESESQTNIMRYDMADYMDVSDSSSTEEYALMGVGFETLDENPNAQEDEKIYVNQKSSSSKVKSYQPEFSFSAEMIKEQEATMKIFDIARNQKTGNDAMVNYVRVELFNPVDSKADTYKARKFKTSVIVSSNSGAGGDPLALEGSLKAVGDFIDGEFNTATRTFTASSDLTE